MPDNNRIVELIIRKLNGEAVDAELAELDAWMALSAENRQVAEEFLNEQRLQAGIRELVNAEHRVWQRLEQHIASVPAGTEAPPPSKVRRLPLWTRIAAAAVLVLALGLAVFYSLSTGNNHQQATVNNQRPTDVSAPTDTRAVITLADGRKIFLDSAGTGTLVQQDGVAVVKNSEGEIVYQSTSPSLEERGSGGEVNVLYNPRGSKVVSLTLSDGTRVWLNAESSLRYPASFAAAQGREVEITGEAYFEVTHDPSKPFKVAFLSPSGGGGPRPGEVTVLGTHFNVNAYDDEEAIRVTLLQGSVRVSSGNGDSKVIKPGEQASVNKGIKVSEVDVDDVMAWKDGIFLLNNADVPTIMRQISRWYDVNVVYEGKIPTTRFGGGVAKDQPLSKILETLEQNGLHFQLDGRTLKVK